MQDSVGKLCLWYISYGQENRWAFLVIPLKSGSKNRDASNELRGSSWLNLELKLWLKDECWEGKLVVSLLANHQWCRAATPAWEVISHNCTQGGKGSLSKKAGLSDKLVLPHLDQKLGLQHLHSRSLGSSGRQGQQEVAPDKGWFITMGFGIKFMLFTATEIVLFCEWIDGPHCLIRSLGHPNARQPWNGRKINSLGPFPRTAFSSKQLQSHWSLGFGCSGIPHAVKCGIFVLNTT